MDAYWARLKKHLYNAAETYGSQDNVAAHRKARLLGNCLQLMDNLDDSTETDPPIVKAEVHTPSIEELRRKFLDDDGA